jgi:tetratricopeptide (TPR) repeat protein
VCDVPDGRFYTRRVLLGRERQVRQLRSHIEGVAAGRGGLLLVVGEAGAGKTRLAEEAIALAADNGVDAHRVTCWAEAGAPPFWPWTQLLVELGADPLDVATDGGSEDSDHELARFRLFSSVAETLRVLAAEQPRLLVVDDLHWADPPSIRLLAFLAPLLRDAALIVLATYRDGDAAGPTDVAVVLPDLVRHGLQLAVPPLDRSQLGLFVADLVGNPVAEELVTRLHVLTAGNPLFAREVVSLLEAQGALDAREVTELPFPESVRVTLTRRLDTVSRPCRDALGVASVVGVEFGVEVVCETATLDADSFLKVLDEAEGARLVRDAGRGRFAFTHPLIRETAYRELGLARRVRLHEEVAKALERLDARGGPVDAAELAHHFRKASPGGNAGKAVAYAEEAGRRAMAMLAYEAAVAHFEHALETMTLCPPDAAHQTDLLLHLGDARLAAGNLPQARLAFDDAARLAREHRWPDRLARAALGCGSGTGGFEVPPFDAAQIELLREALQALGDSDPTTRAWLLARLSVALSMGGSDAERLALSDEAVALSRIAADDRALAYALAAHCDVIPGPEFCEARVAEAAEIVALARLQGDARAELLGRRLRVLALAELGRFVEMDAEVDAYAHVADAIRQPLYAWYVPLWRGMRALMDGRFDDAAEWCTEAEAIGVRAHSENAEMLTLSLQLWWLLHAGMPDEAYARALGISERWHDLAFMVRPGAAMAAARAGRLDEARSLLDAVDLDNRSPYGAEWLPSLAMAAEAAACIGGHPLAPRLYDGLLPYRGLYAIDGIAAANYGSVERPLGLLAATLGRRDDARAHLEAALANHRGVHAPVLVEITRADLEALFGASEAVPRARAGVLRREGEVWALSYEGRTVRLRHTKGIGDIARLLAQPGREIPVLDLASEGHAVTSGDSGPRLDATARDAYKRRLVELDADIDDADAAADAGRSERLHAERDALLAELSAAFGLGGRARRSGDPAERARSAVTQRIRDAMTRIEAEHPSLGAHLRRAVRTGLFCVYEPDGPVDWEIVSQP